MKNEKKIKEINQVQQKENSNNLITQNNETLLVQVSNHVQVEDINEDNYMTEEKIKEVVIETNQVLPLVQSNKRKKNNNKDIIKKQKISSISLNAKENIIDLNIQDEISLQIKGKYKEKKYLKNEKLGRLSKKESLMHFKKLFRTLKLDYDIFFWIKNFNKDEKKLLKDFKQYVFYKGKTKKNEEKDAKDINILVNNCISKIEEYTLKPPEEYKLKSPEYYPQSPSI
ncbi:hypothetical protein C2G38_2187865 [Gigaspora rosea]|uniref:Uncharacterized protein n=1 Tax=Gigaspora rosea TaxID=44941 RepID=A0A397V4A1_9GLOM|nr:hypothetical protein C2G38_2187865 [Gigaspora rosea]